MSLFNIHLASKSSHSAATPQLLPDRTLELSDTQLNQINGGLEQAGDTLSPYLGKGPKKVM